MQAVEIDGIAFELQLELHHRALQCSQQQLALRRRHLGPTAPQAGARQQDVALTIQSDTLYTVEVSLLMRSMIELLVRDHRYM